MQVLRGLLLFGVTFSAFMSCKTPVPLQKTSELTASESKNKFVCYGNRSVLALDGSGLDLEADTVTLGNAYWLGVISAAIYNDHFDLTPYIKKLGGDQLLDSHFYAPEELGGWSSETVHMEFKKGWLLAFRGTQEMSDFVTVLDRVKFRLKALNTKGDFDEMEIHRGFYRATEKVMAAFLKTYLQKSPTTELALGSEEAFQAINLVLRAIASDVDVFDDFEPNLTYAPLIKQMQDFGSIKRDASMREIVGALSIWGEEMVLATKAWAAGSKSKDFTKFNEGASDNWCLSGFLV